MDYKNSLEYLAQIQNEYGSIYTLDDIRYLAELAGSPQKKLKVVHIAGTNGKGSTGAFIANALAMSGYRVGRFVSPAVMDKREVIQCVYQDDFNIVTDYISENEFSQNVSYLADLCNQMKFKGYHQPTSFEIQTVLAFLMFKKWKTDIVIVETGMGGKDDATNIIETPIVSVLTLIGMDHMDVLGNTIEEIAFHKFGIIKHSCPVVSTIQQPEIMSKLVEYCKQSESQLIVADMSKVIDISNDGDITGFTYKKDNYRLSQRGLFQIQNAIIAIEVINVIKQLGFRKIKNSEVANGILKTHWPARFDVVSKNPYIIVDGAHNPSGVDVLTESLEWYYPGEKFNIVIGVFKDKDYVNIIKKLSKYARRFYTVKAPGERGLDSGILAQIIVKLVPAMDKNVFDTGDAKCSIEDIRRHGHHEKTLICGSLSFLKDVYDSLISD